MNNQENQEVTSEEEEQWNILTQEQAARLEAAAKAVIEASSTR